MRTLQTRFFRELRRIFRELLSLQIPYQDITLYTRQLTKGVIRHVRQVLATWRGMLEGMRVSASVS